MTVDMATKLMNGEKLTFDNDAEREIYVPVKLITARTSTRCSNLRSKVERVIQR